MNSDHILTCISDTLTQVRDEQGRLLGAIPKVIEGTQVIPLENGAMVPMRLAVTACVCLPRGISPKLLPNFIPLDPAQLDIAQPPLVGEEGEEGEL